MAFVEFRPVLAAQLVKSDLIETPSRQFQAKPPEIVEVITHQDRVRAQKRSLPPETFRASERADALPQGFKTAGPAADGIVKTVQAVDADGQLAVGFKQMRAKRRRAEESAVGSGADPELKFPM